MIEVLILNALAVFTITFFLKDMDGPFDIFLMIRVWLKAVNKYDFEDGHILYQWSDDGFFGGLFSCHWCLSTWISLLVTLVTCIAFGLAWYQYFYFVVDSIAIAGIVYKYTQGN